MEFSDDFFLEDKDWYSLLSEKPVLLMDYIERTYHASLWAELPELIKRLEEIQKNPAYYYPYLQEVQVHLRILSVTLFKQMLSEEILLFVSFRRREKENKTTSGEEKESMKLLISFIESEFALVKEGCAKIRKLCGNYQLPLEDEILPALYEDLKKVETLILKQIYLESHLLFKKMV